MNRSVYLSLGLAVMVGPWMASGTLTGAATPEPEPPKHASVPLMTVLVAPMVTEKVTRLVIVQGQLDPRRRVEIRAETAGQVVSLPVEKGSRVSAGTMVAALAEDDRLATVAHASIRRAMLELEMERGPGRSRVFVVSHSVSPEMRQLYASYGIECFAIDEELVRSWDGHRTSASDASTGREPSRC